MKKLIVSVIAFAFLALPVKALAQETICTQSYGGGVVCGVHTPVNTGIADNIPLIGSMFLGSSGIFFYFSKRANKKDITNQNE